MRRLLLSALALGLLLGLGTRVLAQGDVKEIIKKAINAHGGAEKLDKFKASKSSSKGTISILGMDLEFTIDNSYQMPDKMKSVIKMEVMGNAVTVEQLVNGDKAKLTVNGMNMEIPDAQKAELKSALLQQKILSLTPLLTEKDLELKALGESKVGSNVVVGIAVSGKDIKEVKIFFDKATNLLSKIERMGLDPMGGGEVKQEIILSDYKDFQGVKRATKTVMTNDGKKFMEAAITDMKLLEKIDDKEFSD